MSTSQISVLHIDKFQKAERYTHRAGTQFLQYVLGELLYNFHVLARAVQRFSCYRTKNTSSP